MTDAIMKQRKELIHVFEFDVMSKRHFVALAFPLLTCLYLEMSKHKGASMSCSRATGCMAVN